GSGDLAGNVQIDGTLQAYGDSTAAATNPGAIRLTGCLVTLTSPATVDSHGDTGASNTITARSGIRIDGKLITTTAAAGGRNVAIFPTGTAILGGGQVSPPFGACANC